MKFSIAWIRRSCGALALLLALAFVAHSFAAPETETNPTFRVMTYNIHHGEGLDGKVDLPRIADLIQREKADLVALQEVDRGTTRTAKRDMPAELAKLTGLTCVFSNNYSFGGGEYGNAVLTRCPVQRGTNFHYPMLRPAEPRGLLQLVLDVHGTQLVFMATHIDHRADDSERWANVPEIEAAAGAYPGKPILLCGDFNDTPGSRVCRKLGETFDDTWARVGQGDGSTIPADAPKRRIDFIWMSKGGVLKPLKAWVPESQASDHRPVVAEFELRPSAIHTERWTAPLVQPAARPAR